MRVRALCEEALHLRAQWCVCVCVCVFVCVCVCVPCERGSKGQAAVQGRRRCMRVHARAMQGRRWTGSRRVLQGSANSEPQAA